MARRDQLLDLAADRRLVLAEAGVDQHGAVGLGEQVAVRHREAAGARRIGANAAVEGERVLQRVEAIVGERRDAAREGVRVAGGSGRFLGGFFDLQGHDHHERSPD
jgi:hypothetical protein